jgi:LysR family glycine cleavage system transcriptional activator
MSFTQAASELNVTQAAISQHVKALESYLNIPLFQRTPRGLVLTSAGQIYLGQLTTAFDLLASSTKHLYEYDQRGCLTVRVPSALSVNWLTPRLETFHKSYPSIDIKITSLQEPANANFDDIDLEIRYGMGKWVGLESILLLEEKVFPVCSPQLAAGPFAINEPKDLLQHELLYVNAPAAGDGASMAYGENWPQWLKAAGISSVEMKHRYSFGQTMLALQAAISGIGIALGRSPLVQDELAAGRLIAPFDLAIVAKGSYWIVYPEAMRDRPKVVAFRDWLLSEAQSEVISKSPDVSE